VFLFLTFQVHPIHYLQEFQVTINLLCYTSQFWKWFHENVWWLVLEKLKCSKTKGVDPTFSLIAAIVSKTFFLWNDVVSYVLSIIVSNVKPIFSLVISQVLKPFFFVDSIVSYVLYLFVSKWILPYPQ
jgi:hypothetical protein